MLFQKTTFANHGETLDLAAIGSGNNQSRRGEKVAGGESQPVFRARKV
jgi:hypothetical protein